MHSIRTAKATGVRTPANGAGAAKSADLAPHLNYSLQAGPQLGAAVGNPLFETLAAVIDAGSIRHAAHTLGHSYRYVWGALRRWEQTLGEPLVIWSQGQRARPTPFAEKLLWAERRARTRMQPHIEALRADLARVLHEARDQRHQLLTIRASHDMALPLLQKHVADVAILHLDIGFQGSVDALRALNARQCQVAGFHVPTLTGYAPQFAKALKPLLKPALHTLIGCMTRTQGLMVRPQNAATIRTFPDLARRGVRFVNRQEGSGTRMLIEHLLHEHAMTPGHIQGYATHVENTHVAVALCVASGVADVGVGIGAAATEFGLHFTPLVEENYYLACLTANVTDQPVQRLCSALAGQGWKDILARLPGYHCAASPGRVLAMHEALPGWGLVRGDSARSTRRAGLRKTQAMKES